MYSRGEKLVLLIVLYVYFWTSDMDIVVYMESFEGSTHAGNAFWVLVGFLEKILENGFGFLNLVTILNRKICSENFWTSYTFRYARSFKIVSSIKYEKMAEPYNSAHLLLFLCCSSCKLRWKTRPRLWSGGPKPFRQRLASWRSSFGFDLHSPPTLQK